jgi:4-alpha-glucanotransferase
LAQRQSGILLHPTSLPGRYGIGELGEEALRFVDFLAGAGQSLWQVLPLGPTGYGDSPYQCFSAFAGNPLLVSLDALAEEGLLSDRDLRRASFPEATVDYGAVMAFKKPLLAKAFAAFATGAAPSRRDAFLAFCRQEVSWLDDFALFMALKEGHGGAAWHTWDQALVTREPGALAAARLTHAEAIGCVQLTQYLFFEQWERVRARARERGIRVMGDIPIFVAHDSSDVWARPDLFTLGADGTPALQAGVPPDYFSATGQLWGNPLYRWDALERSGFAWWIERFRATFRLFDSVRLDHFRGFEAYWEIPGGETTAVNGRWVKAPGRRLFDAVQAALGPLAVVAENLGVITPEVEALRERYGWPGMAILQFAFGDDSQANDFLPYHYPRNRVVYTGGHDNDTTVGWWGAGVGDSTRSEDEVRREHDFALRYVGGDGSEIHWDFIRTVMASVADTAIFPLQDVLGAGSEARMNLPGSLGGNWKWRFRADALTPAIVRRLDMLTRTFGRRPQQGEGPVHDHA